MAAYGIKAGLAAGGALAWKNKDKIKDTLDPGVSWGDIKGIAEGQHQQYEDLQNEPIEVSEAEREQKNVAGAEHATKVAEALTKAQQEPGVVGDQTPRNIKRSQAIAGEGAEAAQEGIAATRAEVERAADETELSRRAFKSSEEQRLLANLYAYREARQRRMSRIGNVLKSIPGFLWPEGGVGEK